MTGEVLSLTGNPIKDARYFNNAPIYASAILKTLSDNISVHESNKVTNWSFLGGTFAEKWINKNCCDEFKSAVNCLDKSLIDSKSSQKFVENVFDCKFHTNKAGEIILTASKDTLKTRTGKLAANALGVTTKFGLLASGLAEAPDLYSAYKNGDLEKQSVRSATNIVASASAFGLASGLFKQYAPAKLKPVFMLAGVAGSLLATKATDEIANNVLGKSIKKQKQEALT